MSFKSLTFWVLSLVVSTCAFALPSYITFPADISWKTRKSDHFQVVYREGKDDLAARVLRIAEDKHRLLAPIFPKGPESTWIVLADFHDATNGYALNFPYSHIVIFAAPPEATSQLNSLDEWLESLILHEYVHILHIYPATGLYKVLRSIFGSWVVPNGLMPTHFHEGMATFFETHFTNGGRGKGSLFRMYRRMAVEANKWNLEASPMDLMEGSVTSWPHGASPYFYGYYMTEELWRRKGAKGIYDLTDEYSSNWPYFANLPLQSVYGLNYEQLWTDIFKRTGDEVREEIRKIKATPLSPLKKLTGTKYLKWELTLSPDGKRLIYRRNLPAEGAAIQILDTETGKEKELLTDGVSSTGMCWGKRGEREYLLFPKTIQSHMYSIDELAGFDLKDEKSFAVPGVSHLLQLGCSADLSSMLTYQEVSTEGVIREWRIDWKDNRPEVTEVRSWKLPQNTWASSFLVGGEKIIALRNGLRTEIFRWRDKKDPERVMDVPAHFYNLRAGRSATELLGIATISGRDEVWAVDLERKTGTKVIGLLGGTNSFDRRNDEYFLTSYEYGGYDVVKASPVSSEKTALSQSAPPRKQAGGNEVAVSAPENYSPLSTLAPTTWVPSFLFVPNGAQISVWIPGFDIAQKHHYNVLGGYDTRGLPFADIDYVYRASSTISAEAGAFIFPSYLISSRTIQKRWGGRVGLTADLDFLPPIVGLSAVYRRVESSPLGPANQSVGPEIALSYRTGFKKRPLDVAPIRGTALSLTHARFFKKVGSTDDYHMTIASASQNLHMPWLDGHILQLQAKAGFTEGSTFANSYFQAGGELILSQQREYFMNRGFTPGTFLSRRVAAFNLDYLFPIARIDRGYGLWPVFLKNVYGGFTADLSTVGSGYAGNYVHSRRDWFRVYYTSVGFELRSDWNFAFYLPAHIRLGAYHGFGPQGEKIYGVMGFEASF